MTRVHPLAVSLALVCFTATGAMAAKIDKIQPASPTVTLEGGVDVPSMENV